MEYDAEARAARAVAMQARVHPANPLKDPRSLVSPATNWRKIKDNCPWCNEPSNEPGSGWHLQCLRYYHAARGATHYEWDGKPKPLVPRTPCAECGNVAQKIDHIIPLVTARSSGGTEMLKAWTPQNLQWLCASCHGSKTWTDTSSSDPKVHDVQPWQPSLF